MEFILKNTWSRNVKKCCSLSHFFDHFYNAVGTLTPVEGNINAEKYFNMIDNNLWSVIAHHFPDDNYTFMDDNGPIHRACTVYQYKENNTIPPTDWPA